jgi:hypothetical protein
VTTKGEGGRLNRFTFLAHHRLQQMSKLVHRHPSIPFWAEARHDARQYLTTVYVIMCPVQNEFLISTSNVSDGSRRDEILVTSVITANLIGNAQTAYSSYGDLEILCVTSNAGTSGPFNRPFQLGTSPNACFRSIAPKSSAPASREDQGIRPLRRITVANVCPAQ